MHSLPTQAPPVLSVLCIGFSADQRQALQAQGCSVTHATEAPFTGALAGGQASPSHDAVLWWAAGVSELAQLRDKPDLPAWALESAWVVCTPAQDEPLETALLHRGVEAIVPLQEAVALTRTLRHAVQRKRLERAARTAYATDLATGLPHQAQLVEHMTQLLALREREPAPMVLLVLRIDGFAQAAAQLGAEAGNVLRRKVAVRLRSGLRASDVVASIGPDEFGVLLGRLEARGDGERVASKLVRSLQQPILVAGQPCMVAAAVGMALYPEHGKDAATLLQRATAQAGSVASMGREGFATLANRAAGAASANDDAS
jgi:diguanylate cyclase (GGDEF)-like protein